MAFHRGLKKIKCEITEIPRRRCNMPSIATTAPKRFKGDNTALIFKSGIEGKYKNEKLSILVIISHFCIPFYL